MPGSGGLPQAGSGGRGRLRTALGLALALMMLLSGGTACPGTPAQTPVRLFLDPFLEQAVSDALGVPAERLDTAALEGVTDLDLKGRGIKDLTGIEKLRSLESLDISHNEVTDVWPLSTLYRLRELNISSNNVLDIMGVKDLPALKWFNMSDNPVGHESTSVYKCELEGRGVVVSW